MPKDDIHAEPYLAKRADFIRLFGRILQDPKILIKILRPVSKETKLTVRDKLKMFRSAVQRGGRAVQFAVKNPKTTIFYKQELEKLKTVFANPSSYDVTDPAFFIRLLQDPILQKFIVENETKVIELINVVLPNLLFSALKDIKKLENSKFTLLVQRLEKQGMNQEYIADNVPLINKQIRAILTDSSSKWLGMLNTGLENFLLLDADAIKARKKLSSLSLGLVANIIKTKDFKTLRQSLKTAQPSITNRLVPLNKLLVKILLTSDKKAKKESQKKLMEEFLGLSLKDDLSIQALSQFFKADTLIAELQNTIPTVFPLLQTQVPILLGIDEKLIIDGLPILGKSMSIFLNNLPDFQGIIKYNKSIIKKGDDLRLINHMRNIVDDAQSQVVVKTGLPRYLVENKPSILQLVKRNFKSIKTTLDMPEDFSFDFVNSMLNEGIPLSTDFLDLIFDIAQHVLKQPGVVVNIIEEARAARKPGKIAKLKLINSVWNLKNSDPKLTELINKQLPDLLAKHAIPLGQILDQFVTQTKLGKNLSIQTERFLKAVSQDFPQLTKLAKLSTIHKYIAFLRITLLNKKLFVLVSNKVMRYLNYQYKEKIQLGIVRRYFVKDKIIDQIKTILTPSSTPPAERIDLGGKLEHIGKSEKKYSTATYSLINRDFRGLHFALSSNSSNSAQGFSFSNCLLQAFNFNDSKLNCAFDNSELTNCSFKNAHFDSNTSFNNVKIDQKTLDTLLPAIETHNKKYPSNQITPSFTLILEEEKKSANKPL